MKFRAAIAILLALVLSALRPAHAEDFAIRTQIFRDDGKRPLAENLTVFRGDKIYDFLLTEPMSVTEFDGKDRRFVLSDPKRAIKTAVAADELVRFASEEHAKALRSPMQLVRFAASPQFKERFDPKTGRLSLTSPVWDYEVETEAWKDSEQQRRYGEFVHWYAYLNAMFRALPPGLRLELNQTLARHNRHPTRVMVAVKNDGEVKLRQESRHQMVKQLTKSESKRVERWIAEPPSLKLVDFGSYHRAQLEKPE